MAKTASYHRAAVQYNKEAVDFFAGLASRLEDSQVSRWAAGISRQHQFHLDRHTKALSKAETKEPTVEPPANYYDEAVAMVDASADFETKGVEQLEIIEETLSIADQQRQFAEQQNTEARHNEITEAQV